MSRPDSLVTVCLLTYNSAEFVRETLDSIKNQTYHDIRLVISDDFSSDDTVDICRAWLGEHRDRFASAVLLTTDTNTGVTANCNRAVRAAEGRWVKLIAGDDILMAHAVETLVTKAESVEYDRYFVGGFVQPFSQDGDLARENARERQISAFGRIEAPAGQLEVLRCKNLLLAPTVLLPSAVFDRFMFDETYPFAEDYPMFLHMLEAGYRYINLDEPLVRYRIHTSSISNEGRAEKLYSAFYKRKRLLEEGLQLPYVGLAVRAKLNHDYYVRLILDKLGLNRKNMVCQIIFSICLRLNPFFYIGQWSYNNKLKKHQSQF